jgi:hypothetical protein
VLSVRLGRRLWRVVRLCFTAKAPRFSSLLRQMWQERPRQRYLHGPGHSRREQHLCSCSLSTRVRDW